MLVLFEGSLIIMWLGDRKQAKAEAAALANAVKDADVTMPPPEVPTAQ
jgi:hypothetical protein